MRSLACVLLFHAAAASARTPRPAPAPAATLGVWRQLVQEGARWELVAKADRERAKKKPAYLTIETAEVHQVGEAVVATLKWTLRRDGTTALAYAKIPIARQVAVAPAGVYFFLTVLSDKEIAAALHRPPIYVEPPTTIAARTRADGKYLLTVGSYVCVGEGPAPEAPECNDVCTGELCIDPRTGIVSVDGNYAPDGVSFRTESFRE